MKVSPAIKPRCSNCQRIRRRGVNRIICKTKRHTQRQG